MASFVNRSTTRGPRARHLLARLFSRPTPAAFTGLDGLESRVLFSTSLDTTAAPATSPDEQTVVVGPAAPVQTQATTEVDAFIPFHDPEAPGGCNCPMCVAMAANADSEAEFQKYISDNLPQGAGASVAAGSTTDIASTVPINNYTPAGRTPFGADYRDNSEFMAGDVYVNVVLLESNGGVDASTENWTTAQIGQVKSEVMEGLNWWEATFHAQNPNSKSNLRFFADFTNADTPVQTRYEPITHKYSEYGLWVDDFLTAKSANTASSSIDDMRRYNNSLRNANGTDWSFTIFIANSAVDTDGKFSDGYFAYSYFGGPFLTMTYDNSGWGISRMGQVLAHETGHIFYALDEYAGSGTAGYYTNTSGYYNVQNLNAADQRPAGSPTRVASMMAEASLQTPAYSGYTSSPTSLQMLGWRDTDSDGVFDVLDVPFTLTGSGSYNSSSSVFTFSGSSAVGTLPNLNQYGSRNAVTTNTIDALQYRIDGGGWSTASSYSMYSGTVAANVNVASAGAGSHTIEFRTLDLTTGVESNLWSSSFTAGAAATPGFNVSPTGGLTTSETGASASFTVSLKSQPTANVTIALASLNTAEGTIAPTTLTFTPSNWNVAQTVAITGVNDYVDDGNVVYTIRLSSAVSSDTNYNGLDPADVTVTNTDNDTAGYTVSAASITTSETGSTASFTVKLNSQPTANVTIPVSSTNTAEGVVSVASLTFTPSNWNIPQSVFVTGVNDNVADGNIPYTVTLAAATSTDTTYNGLKPANVSAVNNDNDTAGVTVSPVNGLSTSESGGVAYFTVKLNSQPTANVTLPLASSDTTEGVLSIASLTFTSSNWNTPQTVAVTGIDDSLIDGAILYSVVLASATSGDAKYSGMNPADVSILNADNDTPGVAISRTSGLIVGEDGTSDSFTVVLTSQPSADVVIPVATNNTNEATTGVASLTFTAANWSTPQVVTVTGVDDSVDDGDVSFGVVLGLVSSADTYYAGLNPADVAATNLDNDTAGVTVTPTSGLTTTESAGTASFTVALNSQPTGDVVFALMSSNANEGNINVPQLTFTAANWNTAQTVVVNGVDDLAVDGNVVYAINFISATSTDALYNNIALPGVSLTNQDNDSVNANAALLITATSSMMTTETSGTATFTVALATPPVADVNVTIYSSNNAEGLPVNGLLTFTPSNWSTPQTVTMRGVDDTMRDGDIGYLAYVFVSQTNDPSYMVQPLRNIALTNKDNETASGASPRLTKKSGGKAPEPAATGAALAQASRLALQSIALSRGFSGLSSFVDHSDDNADQLGGNAPSLMSKLASLKSLRLSSVN